MSQNNRNGILGQTTPKKEETASIDVLNELKNSKSVKSLFFRIYP